MYKRIKSKIYNVIRDDDENTLIGNIFDTVIISLIILNVIFIVADTFEMPRWYSVISRALEIVSVTIFTVEYALRLFTADLKYPSKNAVVARLRYMVSFMAIIDLLAILPFYIPLAFDVDLRVLRALRIFRLFRIFKFGRYTMAMKIVTEVFKRKRHQLLSSVMIIFILMIISSVIIYSAEHDSQPDIFKNAFSGLWWSVATFTTVGYGDIFPITAIGKFFSACIALLGIGIVAVPTGIISAGFIELSDEKENKDEKKFCPYCGHEYEK